MILLGSPAFYPRFGFVPGSAFGLRNPFAGVQPDGFVVAEEDFMLRPARRSAGAHARGGPLAPGVRPDRLKQQGRVRRLGVTRTWLSW